MSNLRVDSEVTFTGGGNVFLGHLGFGEGNVRVGAEGVLINVDNVFRGAGIIWVNQGKFTNQSAGKIIAESSTPGLPGQITIRGDQLENWGTLMASSTGILSIQNSMSNDGVMQASIGGVIRVAGVLSNGATGSLEGGGTIDADIGIVNAGHIAPGDSVGTLRIDSDVFLTAQSVVEIEIDHFTADRWDVRGDLILDGELWIDLVPGEYPSSSDTYQIISVSGGLLWGTFAGIQSGDRIATADGNGSFEIMYTTRGVFLSGFALVPEPGSITALAMLSLAGAARRRRPGQSS